MGEGTATGTATQVVNFKEVAFFRVPTHWVVESEEDGGIVIYEDSPGSGTLRPWTEEYAFYDADARELAADEVHNGHPTEPLGERAKISYAVHDVDEAGESLRLHQWIVAILKGEDRMRVITFTHSIEAAKEGSREAGWELQVVALAVRHAIYPEGAPEASS